MPRTQLSLLSKSRFIAGLQCFKRLYLECYEPGHAAAPDPEQGAVLEFGIATGLLARELYPAGILVAEDHTHHSDAAQHTAELLARDDIDVLFEAAFTADDVRVRVDVLERGEAGLWNIIEVKASAWVRDQYIDDAAIQLLTVERAGVAVGRVSVAYLDRIGSREGKLQPSGRHFVLSDVTASVRKRAKDIPPRLTAMREVLSGEEAPTIETGPHCTRPYRCRFFSYCHNA